MAGFDWFWKAMGGKQGRNQKRSLAIVDQAAARVAKLNTRSDADLVARAREITASGEVADAAEFGDDPISRATPGGAATVGRRRDPNGHR